MKRPIHQKQEAIYCMLARFGEAMSSPRRLKIIGLLSQGPKSVDQLAGMTGQSLAATSAHLKVLRASGLVVARKEGRHVWCSLADDSVTRVWLSLRQLGEELLPEVREIIRDYFENPETLAALDMGEVLEAAAAGRVILIDLRHEDEYAAGHLPHARHIASANLASRMKELPAKVPVLAYCRGPYCITAIDGTVVLRKGGYSAQRLPFGVPEWKAAGLPLADAESWNPSKN